MNGPESVSRFPAGDAETASRMLRLGIAGPPRPIDPLIDRLSRDDGSAWLGDALAGDSLSALAALVETPHPAVSLDDLIAIKDASKAVATKAPTRDASLRIMVGYFFSIAAALALHDTNISSRTPDDLRPILIDLASVAPPAWSQLFERALCRCDVD